MRHKVAETDRRIVYALERVEYGEAIPAGFVGAVKAPDGDEGAHRDEPGLAWPTLDEALAWMNAPD